MTIGQIFLYIMLFCLACGVILNLLLPVDYAISLRTGHTSFYDRCTHTDNNIYNLCFLIGCMPACLAIGKMQEKHGNV